MATRESLISGALAPFMEARVAAATRAFARQDGAFSPREASRILSLRLDEGLRGISAEVGAREVALVAVGGYGRGEQFRHSDIDLMVLVPGSDTSQASAVLYPLWDADLKVGHSIRSIEQSLEAARATLETFTALLTARFVVGDPALYERWQRAFARLTQSRRGWLESALREQRRETLVQEPWQLQEMDVKAGRGGMRTFQGARWLDLAEALVEHSTPPPLPRELESALDVLSSARHALHALAERKNDRYLRDLSDSATE